MSAFLCAWLPVALEQRQALARKKQTVGPSGDDLDVCAVKTCEKPTSSVCSHRPCFPVPRGKKKETFYKGTIHGKGSHPIPARLQALTSQLALLNNAKVQVQREYDAFRSQATQVRDAVLQAERLDRPAHRTLFK
eukprot:443484-Pelagomonas_calceolata.AAC.2